MKSNAERGQSIVEFALVLPFLLIILVGIIEFSVLLFDRTMITNAAREGARAGIVAQMPRMTDGEITNIVNNYCASHLVSLGGASAPTVTITRTGIAFGDNLTVQVDYNYQWLSLPNFVADLIGLSPAHLRFTSVMRYE